MGCTTPAFICSDVGRTIAFYQDLLGFPLVELFENRDYEASAHLFFDIGNGNMLAFFDFPGYEHPEFHETLGGVQHLAISMAPEQYAALKERLAAAGVEYRGPDLGVAELGLRPRSGRPAGRAVHRTAHEHRLRLNRPGRSGPPRCVVDRPGNCPIGATRIASSRADFFSGVGKCRACDSAALAARGRHSSR